MIKIDYICLPGISLLKSEVDISTLNSIFIKNIKNMITSIGIRHDVTIITAIASINLLSRPVTYSTIVPAAFSIHDMNLSTVV